MLYKIGLIVFLAVTISPVFAQRPTLCYEDIDDMCGLLSSDPQTVMGALLQPLESQIAGYALVILWGGILGAIWFKTENIMMVGLIGVLVSATITGLSPQAQGVGMLMLGVSFGILLFQLIRQRPAIFS